MRDARLLTCVLVAASLATTASCARRARCGFSSPLVPEMRGPSWAELPKPPRQWSDERRFLATTERHSPARGASAPARRPFELAVPSASPPGPGLETSLQELFLRDLPGVRALEPYVVVLRRPRAPESTRTFVVEPAGDHAFLSFSAPAEGSLLHSASGVLEVEIEVLRPASSAARRALAPWVRRSLAGETAPTGVVALADQRVWMRTVRVVATRPGRVAIVLVPKRGLSSRWRAFFAPASLARALALKGARLVFASNEEEYTETPYLIGHARPRL